jgi:hypothetical protein
LKLVWQLFGSAIASRREKRGLQPLFAGSIPAPALTPKLQGLAKHHWLENRFS